MAPHRINGWYFGPSMDRYRCHKRYIPTTSRCWDVLTIDWFPHNVPFPTVTSDNYLIQTAVNMLSILQSPTEKNSPLTFGSTIKNAFIQVAYILRRETAPPKSRLPLTIPDSEPRLVPTSPPTIPLTIIPAPEMRVAPTPLPPLVPAQTPPINVPPKLSKILTRKAPLRVSPRLKKTKPCLHTRHYTHGYNRAFQHLSQYVYQERYVHHISSLGTSSPV